MIDPVVFTESLCELQKLKDEYLQENKYKIVTQYIMSVYKKFELIKESDSDIKSFLFAMELERQKLKKFI